MQVTGNNSIHYSLSIRVKADGFSFVVTESGSGDVLHSVERTSQSAGPTLPKLLQNELQSPETQQYTFSRIRVTIDSDSTHVPQQEFDAQHLKETYEIVYPKIDTTTQEVIYTHLPQLNIVQLFTIPIQVKEVITGLFPEATFTNSFAVVLGRIATFCKRQQLPKDALFAYATTQKLFLFSIDEEKLRFANSFSTPNDQDALFFLLSVWKALGLNALTHCCYIAGEKDAAANLTDQVKKYIKTVQPIALTLL